MFEYYVMNYDFNRKKVYMFNIFRNHYVKERTEKAIKKYLRSPSKYKYIKQYKNPYLNQDEIAIYGFEALCAELRMILMNQFWSRREYEISVSDAFIYEIYDIVRDLDKYTNIDELKMELTKQNERNARLEKWDVFKELESNIPIIARECIYQYKQYLKNGGNKDE